jgi:hypothetical protein
MGRQTPVRYGPSDLTEAQEVAMKAVLCAQDRKTQAEGITVSSDEKMQRVTRKDPCPVCGKPDWCLVAPDGSAAICPRIEEGSVKKCGDAGYLHILRDRHNGHNRHRSSAGKRRLLKSVSVAGDQTRDFGVLAEQYQQQLAHGNLSGLSRSLGVSVQSLKRLGIGWDGKAYTFPMSNDFGKVIGIRRRFRGGRKASVKCSRTGLFVPADLPADGPLLICEGATDTAAALDLGFAAIGRPNCSSRILMIARFVKGRPVVVVGDNDDSGRVGTEKLAAKLVLRCPAVRIVCPPQTIKDLRQWLISGLTSARLGEVISAVRPIEVRTSFSRTKQVVS